MRRDVLLSPGRVLLTVLCLGIAVSVAAVALSANGRDSARADTNSFDRLVSGLQSQDGVVCTTPPMLWLARLAVRAAQPEGVLDLRLAMFEGDGLQRLAADRDFGRLMARIPQEGWTPLVTVRSRKSREMSAVHVRQERGRLSLLVLAIDGDEAVVVEAAIRPDTLTRWLDEPHLIARRTH